MTSRRPHVAVSDNVTSFDQKSPGSGCRGPKTGIYSTFHCLQGCNSKEEEGPIWPLWGRCRAAGPHLVAVGAWFVPWAPSGRRRGMTVPLGPGCLAWGCGRSPGPRLAFVSMWPVSWAPVVCRRGGLPLEPRPPGIEAWPSFGAREAAVGVCLFH